MEPKAEASAPSSRKVRSIHQATSASDRPASVSSASAA